MLRFLGEAHRGVKGFVKDENFRPIEGASMKVRGRDVGFQTTKVINDYCDYCLSQCVHLGGRILEDPSARYLYHGGVCRGFCTQRSSVCHRRAEPNHA